MKKRSIKARVTLWYTSFLVAVLLVTAGFLFLTTSSLSRQQMNRQLVNAVTDTVGAVHFRYGELDSSRLDFYQNGVSLFLYDQEGYLVAPKVNLGVQVDALLEDQTLKTVEQNGSKWLVYDLYAVDGSTGFWVRGLFSLTESTRISSLLWLLMLLVLPGVILIAAVGGWRITRRAFLPVEQMAQTADAISSGSDLSQRIPLPGKEDELYHLGATLNRMLSRLQRSFEAERRFTSDVSHELRTPLSVIRSQCDFALSPQAAADDRQEALVSISHQCSHMSATVSQLLLLARGDNGTFQPRWETVELSELWEMVCLDLAAQAEQKGLSLQWQLEPDIRLTGDETLLIRLLTNLLANAIGYNRPQGSIQVRLYRRKENAVLEVADTGIGIPPQQLNQIWERFFRGDASRSGDGSGLGLSMVRWIARIHGGDASVQSVVGEGSIFTVELPLKREGPGSSSK